MSKTARKPLSFLTEFITRDAPAPVQGASGLICRRVNRLKMAVAVLAAIFAAGTIRAQISCPANTVSYAYTGPPFTGGSQWWLNGDYLCWGDNTYYDWCTGTESGKPTFDRLSIQICLPASCNALDLGNQPVVFSASSGPYTINQTNGHFGNSGGWGHSACDSHGNIQNWFFGFSMQQGPLVVEMQSSGNTTGVGSGDDWAVAMQNVLPLDPTIPTNDGAGAYSHGGRWIGDPDCADALAGAITFTANGPNMQATFTPPGGLQFAANLCEVDHFNWQQLVTLMQDPGAPFLLVPPLGRQLTAPPKYYDPPPAGTVDYGTAHAVYCKGEGWNVTWDPVDPSYPFFDSNAELAQDTSHTQLSFLDYPSDPCWSGADPNSYTPGTHAEFKTWLEGVDLSGNPVDLGVPNGWDWLSTWDGTNGGAYGAKNRTPPDPGSGTGGVSVLSINGVPTRGPCATNATPSVAVKRGGFVYSMGTGRFTQAVTLTNTSAGTVTGPVSLVLDGLTNGVSLFNAAGMTYCTEPVGSSYVSTPGGLASGQSVSLTLQFTDPTKTGISYTPRVLSGLGPQ